MTGAPYPGMVEDPQVPIEHAAARAHTTAVPQFYRQRWPKPWLTPSLARTLLGKSPYHAQRECPFYGGDPTPPTPAMIDGYVLDLLVLGGDVAGIEVVDADSWRPAAARHARDDAFASGLIPITRGAFTALEGAAGEISRQIPADVLRGTIKKRVFWGDAPACSTEPDVVCGAAVYDLKLTRVTPTADNWRRHVSRMSYDLQAAATVEATGAERFAWIVAEAQAPHCVVIHWASEQFMEHARRRWADAKSIWNYYVTHERWANEDWPGYVSGEIDPMPSDMPDEDDMIFMEGGDDA